LLCYACFFRILYRFIDPGHILVEDGEADVELGCREDLEYVVMKLDDTIQHGRYIHYNILLSTWHTECITKQLALNHAVEVACVQ
jgi:hypothetical protein